MREIKETNPVRILRREKEKDLEKDFSELTSYRQNKLKLQYPTFFIPGWTGENCSAWKEFYPNIAKRYKEYYKPIKYWVDEIIGNKEEADFVTFTEEESMSSKSFIELGKYLKQKLFDKVKDSPINLVGHSMGGLDIRAAVIDDEATVLNVKNVITVGTPNNGTPEAGLFKFGLVKDFLTKLGLFKQHHIQQGYNLCSGSIPIRFINTIENKIKLLNKIDKFYVLMGLRDFTVRESPKLNREGIPDDIFDGKVKTIQTFSAEHSNKDGITQDPRILLPMLKILCGIELKDDYNYGYIFRADV
jgi:hypothetical protein